MKNLLVTLLGAGVALLLGFGILELQRGDPGARGKEGAGGAAAPGPSGASETRGEPADLLAARRPLDVDEGDREEPRGAGGADPAAEAPAPAQATAEELARVELRFRNQAEDIAKALDLVPRDQEALYEILLEAYRRRAAYFESMRAEDVEDESRERVAAEMARIQEWKTEALQAELGPELAAAVLQYERENNRGLFERNYKRELERPTAE